MRSGIKANSLSAGVREPYPNPNPTKEEPPEGAREEEQVLEILLVPGK